MATRIGNYEILTKLGQGGMGAVFKATQLSMDRVVALKVLPPKLAENADFVARFMREAKSAGALSHPNLVNAIECGKAGSYYFIAMEFVPGPTLKALLQERGRLDEQDVIPLAIGIARGLEAAHNKGIVHRDVKPENVLLDAHGQAKLADLGLAKPMTGDADVTMGGVAIGTPHYLSPEQARGEPTDGRSDIYSLGATAFHLLAGETLFSGPTATAVNLKHVTDQPRHIRELRPDVSAGLDLVIARCLAKDADHRYADCAALIADLIKIAKGEAVAPVTKQGRHAGANPATRSPFSPRSGPPLALVGGGIAALAVLAIGGYLLFAGAEPTPAPAAAPSAETRQGPKEAVKPTPAIAQAPAENKAAADPEAGHKDAAEMLAFAEHYLADNPDQLDKALEYFKRAQKVGRGSVVELKADQAIDTLVEQQQAARSAAWQAIARPIIAARDSGDYDQALQLIAAADQADHEQLAALRTGITTAGQQAVDVIAAELETAVASQDWQASEAAITRLIAIRFADGVAGHKSVIDKAKRARASAAQAAEQAAAEAMKQQLAGELKTFVGLITAGEWFDARNQVDNLGRRLSGPAGQGVTELGALLDAREARQAAILTAVQAKVGEDVAVSFRNQVRHLRLVHADAKGLTVRFGGSSEMLIPLDRLAPAERDALLASWQAQTEADRLLIVIEAISARQLDQAAKELTTVTASALGPLLKDLIRLEQLDAVEAAAVTAWESLAQQDPAKMSEADARQLIADLDIYADRHGETECHRTHAKAWQTLRTAAFARTAEGRLRSGLQLHLSFDDDPQRSGNRYTDHSGHQRHWQLDQRYGLASRRGRLGTSLTWQPNGRQQPGAGFGPQAGSYAALCAGWQQATWTFWMSTSDLLPRNRSPGRIAGFGGWGQERYWELVWNGKSNSLIGKGPDDGSVSLPARIGRHWHHVAVVFDADRPAAERLSIHIDGSAATHLSSRWQKLPAFKQDGFGLFFCIYSKGGKKGLRPTWRFDDLRIYDRALSADDLSALLAAAGTTESPGDDDEDEVATRADGELDIAEVRKLFSGTTWRSAKSNCTFRFRKDGALTATGDFRHLSGWDVTSKHLILSGPGGDKMYGRIKNRHVKFKQDKLLLTPSR